LDEQKVGKMVVWMAGKMVEKKDGKLVEQ
jgi:hypothetical protein